MNPVIFSTGTATYGCAGGGGVTLKADMSMRFSFSCSEGFPPGQTAISIAGEGTYAAAGVPEPATWAMMIAGFGLLGAFARRRRVSVSYA